MTERPWSEYDEARALEPSDCPWDCGAASCDHAGLCTCGATNLRPLPQRCRMCGRPLRLRSV